METKRLVILVPSDRDMEAADYKTKYWPNFIKRVEDALSDLGVEITTAHPDELVNRLWEQRRAE